MLLKLFTKKQRKIDELGTQLNLSLKENQDWKSTFDALNRSMAIIEFNPDGSIITANSNFLSAVGYQLDEVMGKHHRIFCLKQYADSTEYAQFWQRLAQGEFTAGQIERVTKSGQSIWLEASYNPVYDEDGKVFKVIKIAADISQSVNDSQLQNSTMDAIDRSTAVIEFTPDGTIQKANENFLNASGYSLDEIKGKHHSIFCSEKLKNSIEYKEFWQRLNRGEYTSGLFPRVNKQGDVIWLEASYNPLFDVKGNLTRVIKFASDVTARVNNSKKAQELAYSTSLETESAAREGTEVAATSKKLMSELSANIQTTASSLTQLNSQADQIKNIVSTISGIAEQTNLLALNAAIEAARAGEQGRGFAVVADEVRSLAARTSASTSEISSVVNNNLELVLNATKTMEQSLEGVDSSVELVERISAVIEQISEATQHVVSSVNQID